MKKLTKKDCGEIYYALMSKSAAVSKMMPFDDKDRARLDAWARHLARIIAKIGRAGSLLFKEGLK